MSATCAILAALVPLLATADAAKAQAEEPVPVTFARAGGKATVTIPAVNLPSMTLALRAYGRVWTTADARDQGNRNVFVATFAVPAVRVPVVFSVTHEHLEKPELAQVVAHPDRDVPWNEEAKKDGQDKPVKKITLYAAGAPEWFNQWSAAVGLPVRQVDPADMQPVALDADGTYPPTLLVVGRTTAGKAPADAAKLAVEKKLSVLILEAAWFGPAGDKVAVAPRQMQADLAEMAAQSWPRLLEFSYRQTPCGGIMNRWRWIADGDNLPLVEEVRLADVDQRTREQQRTPPGQRVVTSYLPWHERLGRSESADALLLALLKAAAQPRPELRWRMAELVWPLEPEVFAAERPVLRAALDAWPLIGDVPAQLDVLDLRGPNSPPLNLKKKLKDTEGTVERTVEHGDRTGLLILGDDKVLDEWRWLKLDRAKKTVGRQGVAWLSDDKLPPSKDNQVRLMLTLTELGVPLAPPAGEKEKRQ